MTLGFTGTQRGMTQRQLATVERLFNELPLHALHHGCCIGADAQAHRLAVDLHAFVVGHPPAVRKKVAALTGYDQLREPLDYLMRNGRIVKDGMDGLIAAPAEFEEKVRSGTWATVRIARRQGRRAWIVFPDGTFKEERPFAGAR